MLCESAGLIYSTGVSGNEIARQVVIAEENLVSAKSRVIEMEKLRDVSHR